MINCVSPLNLDKNLPKLSTLTSSSAASTSSSIQNGTGLTLRIANNNDIAVRVFSPPDRSDICWSFLPGGRATISIPVSSILSGSVSFNSALPPPNNILNVSENAPFIFSNVYF